MNGFRDLIEKIISGRGLELSKKKVIIGTVIAAFCLVLAVTFAMVKIPKRSGKAVSAKEYYEKGMDDYERGDFEKAIRKFKEVTEKEPKNSRAYYMLGLSHEALGQLDKAIVEYEKTVKLNPKKPEPHYNLAIVYKARGKTNEAISQLEKAVKLYPNFVGARLMLARYYREENQTDKAIEEYKKIIEINPYGFDLTQVHNELGLVYLGKEMKEEAIGQWQATLKMNPENKQAQELLGEHSK